MNLLFDAVTFRTIKCPIYLLATRIWWYRRYLMTMRISTDSAAKRTIWIRTKAALKFWCSASWGWSATGTGERSMPTWPVASWASKSEQSSKLRFEIWKCNFEFFYEIVVCIQKYLASLGFSLEFKIQTEMRNYPESVNYARKSLFCTQWRFKGISRLLLRSQQKARQLRCSGWWNSMRGNGEEVAGLLPQETAHLFSVTNRGSRLPSKQR